MISEKEAFETTRNIKIEAMRVATSHGLQGEEKYKFIVEYLATELQKHIMLQGGYKHLAQRRKNAVINKN